MSLHPISEREVRLLHLYAYCQLGMTPQQFALKWAVSREEMALVTSRSKSTVQRWFSRGASRRHPTPNDLRHLALMNFLLEHFEEIPAELWSQLCPPIRD